MNPGDFAKELSAFAPVLIAGVFFCIPFAGKFYEKHKKNVGVVLVLACLFWFAVYRIVNEQGNPFMYANF